MSAPTTDSQVIDSRAIIAPEARIAEGVRIGPLSVVEGDVDTLRALVDRRVGITGEFRVTAEWPVKVLRVTGIEALATGGAGTGTQVPPAQP